MSYVQQKFLKSQLVFDRNHHKTDARKFSTKIQSSSGSEMETKKLKIFESVKKMLASIDLNANQRPFHRKQLLHIVQGFCAIILQCLYLVYEANTIREYMNSIFMTTVGILVYMGFWSAIFKTTIIYEFIDQYETIVNGSEYLISTIHGKMSIFRINVCVLHRAKICKIKSNLRKYQSIYREML